MEPIGTERNRNRLFRNLALPQVLEYRHSDRRNAIAQCPSFTWVHQKQLILIVNSRTRHGRVPMVAVATSLIAPFTT